MALRQQAALGSGIDECFGVVDRGVKADHEPEIAGSPQRKASKHSVQKRRNSAHPSLPGVSEMECAKCCRKKKSRRPEADSGPKRELGIAAKKELLKNPHK